MKEAYTLDEIKEKLEHEKYLRKENQELYEELQTLRKCSNSTNDLANEYKKRIDKALEYIKLCLTEAYNEEETKLPIEYMEQVEIYLEGEKRYMGVNKC